MEAAMGQGSAWLLVFWLVNVLALPQANGPAEPRLATIVVPEVEVRSGPGTLYYPTEKLKAGSQVKVWRVVNDWAEIAPPPGAFSLVPKKAVTQLSASTGKINRSGTETLIGSHVVKQAQRTGRKLEAGHLVQITGTEWVLGPEGAQEYFRIVPDGERRYLPATALAHGGSEIIQTQHSQPSVEVPSSASTPAALPPAHLPDTVLGTVNAAEQAYRHGELTGDWNEARRLYGELAQSPFHHVRMTALNRLEFIRQRQGLPAPGPLPSGSNGAVNSLAGAQRIDPYAGNWRPVTPEMRKSLPTEAAPLTVTTRPGAPRDGLLTNQASMPSERLPERPVTAIPGGNARLVTPPQQLNNPIPPAVGPRWTPGLLRQAYQRHQGQPLYYLVDASHQLRCFLTPGPGVDLASYVDRNVEVLGNLPVPRADLNNKPHMTVTQVRPLSSSP
jgi:hypothetical protein